MLDRLTDRVLCLKGAAEVEGLVRILARSLLTGVHFPNGLLSKRARDICCQHVVRVEVPPPMLDGVEGGVEGLSEFSTQQNCSRAVIKTRPTDYITCVPPRIHSANRRGVRGVCIQVPV